MKEKNDQGLFIATIVQSFVLTINNFVVKHNEISFENNNKAKNVYRSRSSQGFSPVCFLKAVEK
jgi:hypothetical protein